MDKGRFWQVERYLSFVERVRESATVEVENAIDFSFIGYLAFSEVTENRYQAMKWMPRVLMAVLLEIDGAGRWA